MSNAISKQTMTDDENNTNANNKSAYDQSVEEWINDWHNNYERPFTNDRLVLCFEEVECDTGEIDMVCFVLYDPVEKEYFICGKRYDVYDGNKCIAEYGDYKFFCKSKTQVAEFLKSAMDIKNNKINQVLYNYKDIFYDENGEEYEYLDFDVLITNKNQMKEVSAYDGLTFNKNRVITLLKMIKHVRY